MKMMSCICDEDDQTSSSGSPESSPSPLGSSSKMKSTLFLKSRPVKVQRSASAILRSKMYQVIKKKKKPKDTTLGNICRTRLKSRFSRKINFVRLKKGHD